MLKELLDRSEVSIIISFILGLGLASLFRQVCNDDSCVVVRGPNPSEVEQKEYKTDDGCYIYQPYPVKCNVNSPKRSTLNDDSIAS